MGALPVQRSWVHMFQDQWWSFRCQLISVTYAKSMVNHCFALFICIVTSVYKTLVALSAGSAHVEDIQNYTYTALKITEYNSLFARTFNYSLTQTQVRH